VSGPEVQQAPIAGVIVAPTERVELARESSVLDVIARAARDPSVDVAKLERLLSIQERLITDQRRTAFMAAMARLQAKLPQIAKSGTICDRDGNVRNRFARIEDIDRAVRPLLAEEGFSLSYDSKPGARDTEYSCTVAHRDGHAETKAIVLPRDDGQGRNAVQSSGSTISYARRYLLGMHLNLITCDEDDDGQGEVTLVTAEQAEQLRRELKEVGGSEARFLAWLGVDALESVPLPRFAGALKFIDEKRRQKKGPVGA
jgi:hypothetical protein